MGVEPICEAYETSDWTASLTRNKLLREPNLRATISSYSVSVTWQAARPA
jgi:hypothetical protein